MTTPVKLGPTGAITAPPAVPPVSGLTSLARIPKISDSHWQLGYAYKPESPARVARNRSGVTTTTGANIGRPPEIVEVIPILLEVVDECSTFDIRSEDYVARAKRLMEAYTSKLLERELWIGEIAVADHLPNKYLASPDAIDVTPVAGALSPQKAVSYLMGALGDYGMGDVMVHASKVASIQLPDAWRNTSSYEEFGFMVVPGAGYPGSGPSGSAIGSHWMYATEIVNVRLGPVEVVPDDLAQATDRASNTVKYYVQRVGAVDFAGPVFACRTITT